MTTEHDDRILNVFLDWWTKEELPAAVLVDEVYAAHEDFRSLRERLLAAGYDILPTDQPA